MRFLGYTFIAALLVVSGCTQEEKRTRSKQENLSSANQDQNLEDGASQAEKNDYALAKLFLEQSFGPEGILAELDKIDPEVFADALSNIEKLDNSYGRELGKQVLTMVRDITFESADIDKSKSLNKDEFMSFQIGHFAKTEERQNQINTWKEESFPIVAGGDEEISEEEFLAMLSMMRKNMVKRYHKRGGLKPMMNRVHKDLLANFDENKNGVLDKNEREKIRAAIKAEHERYRTKVAEQCTEENSDKPICKLDEALRKLCSDAKGFLPAAPGGVCKLSSEPWHARASAAE